jgi:hypothetical protein
VTSDRFRVEWSEEDQEWVGLCVDYPSVSHLAPDRNAALEGIRTLSSDIDADIAANGS